MIGTNAYNQNNRESKKKGSDKEDRIVIKGVIPKKTKSKKLQSENGSKDRIKVYLRVRPLLKDERSFDYDICDNSITIHPLATKNTSYFFMEKSFKFRKILDSSTNQYDVYNTVAAPLLRSFFNGHDVAIFCYGSTNSGKTFTVTGTDNEPGIIYSILDSVVTEILPKVKEDNKIYITFNEIYNERIYDLLSDKLENSLSIGYNDNNDTEVKGCIEVEITSLEQVKDLINQRLEFRHNGYTEFNPNSSRSHTVIRIKYVNKEKYSWFSVVDLAGSERLSIMNSEVKSFKEACNINKGMLVLGKCVRSLKDINAHATHIPIPYRESKLTHMFKNLFEPANRKAFASIIINISPIVEQYDDTIFSLHFAAEASQCSIRQIQFPSKFNSCLSYSTDQAGNSPPKSPEPDTPEMIERKLKISLRQEMEEKILSRQMEYDHGMSSLMKNIGKTNNLEMCFKSGPDVVSSTEKVLNDKIKENESLNSQLSMKQEEINNLRNSCKLYEEENLKLESEIAELMMNLEKLDDVILDVSHYKPTIPSKLCKKDQSSFDELFKEPGCVSIF